MARTKNIKNTLLLLFLLFVPIMLCLTACGKKEPTLEYLTADKNNVNIGTMGSLELGKFSYGNVNVDLDFDVVAVYSDGSRNIVTKDDGVTVTYSHCGLDINNSQYVTIPQLPQTYEVGTYNITYTYKEHQLNVYFTVDRIAPTNIPTIVSKTQWRHDELPCTISATGVTLDDENRIIAITKEKYDSYLNGAITYEQLLNPLFSYNSTVAGIMSVGSYYVFGSVTTQGNYTGGYTKPTLVTVLPGTLSFVNTNLIDCRDYTYESRFGDIELYNLSLITSTGIDDTYSEAYAINSAGQKINGYFSWKNPQELVNSTTTEEYEVVFIPQDDNYNETSVKLIDISNKINKGKVSPVKLGYRSAVYNGESHLVGIYFNGSNNTRTYVKVYKNNQQLTFNEADVVDSVTEVGAYTYKIELADKVNYYWEDDNSTDDRYLTFYVNKMQSNFSLLMGVKNLDAHNKLRIKLEPTLDTYGNYDVTPFIEGTFTITVLNQIDNYNNQTGLTVSTTVTATANIEKDDSDNNYYIVIDVSEFKEFTNPTDSTYNGTSTYGYLCFRVTATGTNNYADIDYIGTVRLYKYTEA